MKKKLATIFLALMLLPNAALASILGSTLVSLKYYNVSDGTVLFESQYMSDQNGVGLQSEYYAEYTPNSDTVPYVATGESIYGKRTASQAAAYMMENGMRPMLGINASFFSTKTGVPMGHVISDGKIMSKDSSTLQSIGFAADGTAFIAPLAIDVNLHTESGDVGVANVNKYNVLSLPGISYYNTDFGDQTRNDVESLSVTAEIIEGDLAIGKTQKAVVTGKFVYQGGLALAPGQIILSINTDGVYEYHYNILNSLEVGDEIELTTSATGDERWANVVNGLGSEGETLIENGVVSTSLPKGAAPRTAVGITAEGKVIFYVIDGRQSGHSYGVQLKTLAARLSELGCVDAINLDGGGSTTIMGVYPGSDELSVLNSPSDGNLRPVTNFIFLKNNNERTGVLKDIYVTPQQDKYLTGTSVELTAEGIDTAYYSMEPGDVTYSVDGESSIEGNLLTLRGSGTVKVTVSSGEIQTTSEHYVYDTPDRIEVYGNGEKVSSINLNNDMWLELTASAYVAYSKLIADPSSFSYTLEGNIGAIDENNYFHAYADRTTDGAIIVTAGTKSVRIPVTVTNNDYLFTDVSEHWAREMIREMALKGVVSGYETQNGSEFLPDNSITRAEFAVMMAKYLNLDTNAYSGVDSIFDDELPDWAAPSICAMYELGYVSGKQTDNGIFYAPYDKITRAEAAAIIGRAANYLKDEAELAFSDKSEIQSWAYTYIARLSAAGVVSGYSDNSFGPGRNVTRAEAVTMLYKLSAIN